MITRAGYTLIEVLMALMILVGTVSVILSFSTKSVMRTWKSRENVERVFLVEERLLKFFLETPEKEKSDLYETENPPLKVKTDILDVDKKSSLNEFLDDIKIVKSEATWKESVEQQKMAMISFVPFVKREEK